MEKEVNYDIKLVQSDKFVEKEREPVVIIPQCCREGWESCPHKAQRGKKVKSNIGL